RSGLLRALHSFPTRRSSDLEDKDDSTEYVYTLFVPMDAEMAFPCFDQPDLKGRFRLELTAPENWTAVSNTAIESQSQAGPGRRLDRKSTRLNSSHDQISYAV